MTRLGLVGWLGLAAAACGDAGSPAAPDSDPMLERGRILSLACQACHSLDAGGTHLIGPNLHGVFERAAGTAAGYSDYSAALQEVDFVWTSERLDGWLADPQGFLPGTSMAFTGFQSADDRASLIAFLLEATRPTD